MSPIVRARREAGLSQRELADRMGVDPSVVSSYETGRRTPTTEMLGRFAEALDAVLTVEIVPRPMEASWRPATLAETASAVRASIGRRARADRHVHEFLRGHQEADLTIRHALVIEEPETTGDGRYDALLGALGEHLSFVDCRTVPRWTSDPGRFLEVAWYWAGVPALNERARVTSPAAFARRLVFVDPEDLRSI